MSTISKLPARAPGFDLARAGAIAAVLICHFLVIVPAPPRLGAMLSYTGEAGVNLFFALSGFLIGRIALRRVHTPRDAVHFWTRRWFRTLPAGFVVAALLAMLLHPSPVRFLETVTFTRGLIHDATESPFLPHYWSLMIEEWFYLLLPLLLLAIGRSYRVTWLVLAWVVLALFHVLAASVLHLGYWQQATLTWMRLDAILAGVIVAGVEAQLGGSARRCLCMVGCCGVAGLFAVMGLTDPAPLYDALLLTIAPRGVGDLAHAAQASLMPALFAMTLPAMAAWQPAKPEGIGWRVVQVAALLTYALYLVHWDIYRFVLRLVQGGYIGYTAACVLALVFSTLLAWVVHVAVERPFMIIRDRIAPEVKVLVQAQA